MYASKIGVGTAEERISILSRNYEASHDLADAVLSKTLKSGYEGFEALRDRDASMSTRWAAKFRWRKAYSAVRELMAVPNNERVAERGNLEDRESLTQMVCQAIATADIQDVNEYISSGLVDVNAIFDTSATYGVTEGFLARPIRNCTFLHLAALVDNVHIMRILCDAKADPVLNSATYFAGVNLTSRLIPSEPAQGPVVTVVDMACFVNASLELMTYLGEQVAASMASRSIEEKWIEPWQWESSQPARQQKLHLATEEFPSPISSPPLSEPGSTRSNQNIDYESYDRAAYERDMRVNRELVDNDLTAFERDIRVNRELFESLPCNRRWVHDSSSTGAPKTVSKSGSRRNPCSDALVRSSSRSTEGYREKVATGWQQVVRDGPMRYPTHKGARGAARHECDTRGKVLVDL